METIKKWAVHSNNSRVVTTGRPFNHAFRRGRSTGQANLSGGRVELFLAKLENSVAEIGLRSLLGPTLIVKGSVPTSKFRRPFLHRPDWQCILAMTLLKFSEDFFLRFPSKTRISNQIAFL
jgi:hypothetical protein